MAGRMIADVSQSVDLLQRPALKYDHVLKIAHASGAVKHPIVSLWE
jgi:hypothetical protein